MRRDLFLYSLKHEVTSHHLCHIAVMTTLDDIIVTQLI